MPSCVSLRRSTRCGTRQRAGVEVSLLPALTFLIAPLKHISDAVPPGFDALVTTVCSVGQLGCARYLASLCHALALA